jgi:hypothetical protein
MEEADKNCDVLVFIGDVQPESLTKPKTEWRHPKLHFAEYTSDKSKEMTRTKPDNDIRTWPEPEPQPKPSSDML